MMGQKETTMTVATEEKGGGTLRRMILVLAAAALMAAMMAVMAAPAFAGLARGQTNSNHGFLQNNLSGGDQQNSFAGCCNRGNSFAFGDFRN